MRQIRLFATPVLLLGLLALLLWGATWGWHALTAPVPPPAPTPCVTLSNKVVTTADVQVRVFNGGFTTGLAGKVAAQLESKGFVILKKANTEERIKTTVIRTNQANEGAIRLIKSQFVNPAVEYDDRIDGTVDVLVGSEFEGFGENPFGQVVVPDVSGACVAPPTATVAASATVTP